MNDELNRSATKLELEGHKPPYYLSYTVHDTETFHVSSLFGAITDVTNNHARDLEVTTRVGDYHLDSNFSHSDGFGDFGRLFGMRDNSGRMPLDDDYDSLRHMLWLRTDSTYKSALKQYESAKAYLERNIVKDLPDSFSKAEPTTVCEPLAKLDVDKDKWTSLVRQLSLTFRQYPDIHQGLASFSGAVMDRWFVNNEGCRDRVPDTGYTLSISADTDAEDGMHLFDQESVPALSAGELPDDAALNKLAKTVADRLVQLRKAPVVEDYLGPIIFEGQSSADFFNAVLTPHLVEKRHTQFLNSNQSEHLGQHLLPNFISVVDDPTATEFKGQHLLDSYAVDDEGVKAQRVSLVEKGFLKTFCMTRTPNKLVKQSNGHCRHGAAGTSNLFINSESKVTPAQLKEKLIQMGKDAGLKYVYIVRKLLNAPLSMDLSSIASMMSLLPNMASSSIPSPVLLYRVSVDDGKEELVRGAQFNNINDRTLRDIEATADDDQAYPILTNQSIKSVIAPSILISEVEIQKSDRNTSKPPLLKNPLFETEQPAAPAAPEPAATDPHAKKKHK